jgi:hypothetical protein
VSAAAILADVVAALEAANAVYMIVGSVASSYHAVPRSTLDIDLVVLSEDDTVEEFLARIDRAQYYVDENAARAAGPGAQFNIIDRGTGWKVDVLLSKDRTFSRRELARRERAEILGTTTYVATAEDTILSKLEWARGRSSVQHEDVTHLLAVLDDSIDNDYLDHWSTELGVRNDLEAARRDARPW